MAEIPMNPTIDAHSTEPRTVVPAPDKERLKKEKAYFEDRWHSQRVYYSEKAAFYKKWYQRIRLFIALTAVVIPVLLSLSQVNPIFPTVLSTFVAMATVFESVYGFGDNWRNFRQTAEVLKRERVMYDAGVNPYNDPSTAFSVFVQNCESAISQETGEYFARDQQQS